MRSVLTSLSAAFAATFAVVALVPAQVAKEDVAGIRNFTKVDAAFACGGAVDPAKGITELAQRGYKSVVSLREPSESGAQVDASRHASEAAGLKYYNLPFNAEHPSDAVVDQFLALVRDRSNEPMFIHCGTGSRAAALWLIKRMLIDKWPADRATSEAIAIGLSSPSLKQFALDYVAHHR